MMSPDLQRAFDNILDCFGGADGAVPFVMLRTMLEILDTKAQDCTHPEANEAMAVLRIVHQFNRLIEIANEGN